MPRAMHNLTKSAGRVTLCTLFMFVAGCDVEAPETGAPERIAGLSTPQLLTGPEIAAATRTVPTDTPPLDVRAAELRSRAADLRGAVLDTEESARLLPETDRP